MPQRIILRLPFFGMSAWSASPSHRTVAPPAGTVKRIASFSNPGTCSAAFRHHRIGSAGTPAGARLGMPNRYVIALAFLLLADADVPRINNLRAPDKPSLNFPSDEQIPVFPSSGASSESEASQSQLQTKSACVANQPLKVSTKLTLCHLVSF